MTMATAGEVQEALDLLAEHTGPEGNVEFVLRANGFMELEDQHQWPTLGQRSCTCPLALYLQAYTGRRDLQVGLAVAGPLLTDGWAVTLPDPVRLFVERVDDRKERWIEEHPGGLVDIALAEGAFDC